MPIRCAAIAGFLLLAIVACGPARAAGEPAATGRLPLEVRNQNFYPATIFVVSNSARVRAGEVPGNSSAALTAPVMPRGRITVEVRLLAVGAFTSFPVDVAPGDTVHVTVPPDLHRRAPGR